MEPNLEKPPVSEEKLLDCFKSMKYILTKENLPYLEDWKRAYQGYLKNDFLVVVVGEFSTGKSTLLNKVLDTDLLPVGDLPTTAMLTRISYGPQNSLSRILPDGPKQELEFNCGSFDQFIASPDGKDPEGVLEVKMDHAKLKQSGVHLFDTPGAGDVFGKRATTVINLLTQCDGVIFTIAAEKPLSKTEKAFMEQYIIAQKTPHICIVLTRLDMLNPENQTTMVKYVYNQVKKISPGIEFVISSERSALSDGIDPTVKCGWEALWEIICQWAACEENAHLKTVRAQAQLNELISKVEEHYTFKIKILRLDEEKRSAIIDELHHKLASLKLLWTEIEIEIEKCRIDFKNWVYDTVRSCQNDIIERYGLEINKINDPKMWYENDFPYRLRTDVSHLAKNIEGNLQKKFYADVNRINEFIQRKFQTSMIRNDQVDLNYQPEKNLFTDPAEYKLAALNKLRWAMRIGTGAATFGSYLIFTGLGPVGILAGAAGAVISESIMAGKLEKQRTEVREMMQQTVNKVFTNALDEIEAKTRKMYSEVAEAIYRVEVAWLKEQEKLIGQKSKEITPVEGVSVIEHKLEALGKIKEFINS
ncbi:MAG TPA: dynamin family protein [Bacillota bacterium]|nr:dynamin family protein [Bacillota bacterium]